MNVRDAPAPHSHRRRRLWVVAGLIVGAVLLGLSLALHPSDSLFYLLTLLLAATWTVAALGSGSIPVGAKRGDRGRMIAVGGLAGLVVAAVFIAGALVVREIDPLRDFVTDVLTRTHHGSLPLVLLVTLANAIAEELFFRGALYAALPTRYVLLTSTLVYAAATAATGNPILVFAALTFGVVLAQQRRSTGALLAPITTHLVWSAALLIALPPLFPSR